MRWVRKGDCVGFGLFLGCLERNERMMGVLGAVWCTNPNPLNTMFFLHKARILFELWFFLLSTLLLSEAKDRATAERSINAKPFSVG